MSMYLYNPTTKQWNIPWAGDSVSGAALVHQSGSGPVATAKNRQLDLAAAYARATNGGSYTSTDNVTEVYITVLPDVAFTNEKKAIVTFDAPTEGVASSFLTDTGGQAVNVQQWALQLGVRNGPYTFSSYLSWLDIKTDVAAIAIIEGA